MRQMYVHSVVRIYGFMVVLSTHLNFTQVGRVRTRFDLSTSKVYAAAIQRAAERLTICWSLVDFRVWGYVGVAKICKANAANIKGTCHVQVSYEH